MSLTVYKIVAPQWVLDESGDFGEWLCSQTGDSDEFRFWYAVFDEWMVQLGVYK